MLPLGTSFPYCFGFIPSTRADGGDPIDVVLFMDEPAQPGTVVPCRVVGILEATQTEKGKTIRNDRVLAVAMESPQYSRCKDIGDFSDTVLGEMERVFSFYNEEDGKVFKVKCRRGRAAARKAVEKGHKVSKKHETNYFRGSTLSNGRLEALVNREKNRDDLIFIDWLRNGRGATSIASYSLRARPSAGWRCRLRGRN